MSTDNTVAIFNVLHCFIYIKVNPLFFTNSSKFLYHANNHLMEFLRRIHIACAVVVLWIAVFRHRGSFRSSLARIVSRRP